jgi:hypothetical protein
VDPLFVMQAIAVAIEHAQPLVPADMVLAANAAKLFE